MQQKCLPKWVRFLTWIIFCSLVILCALKHENWRDEAQAWLLARDLTIPELFRAMSSEGHPCLWHLLLMPFAKLGFPYRFMNVLSCLLVSGAAGLMLWKSEFPWILQATCLLTSAFLYWFPVVSRSYALIPLLLFLCACFYEKRIERPFLYGSSIALLVQTHLHALGMAGIMSCFWLGEVLMRFRKERRISFLFKQGAALSMPLLSFLLLVVQLADVESSSAFRTDWGALLNLKKRIMLFFPLDSLLLQTVAMYLFIALLLLVAIICIRKKKWDILKPLIIFVGGWMAQVVFIALIGRSGIQKAALILPMLLWALWAAWPDMKTDRLLKGICTAALAILCVVFIWNNKKEPLHDLSMDYSDSKNCANFISAHIPENALIFSASDARSASVLAFMDDREGFYSLQQRKLISFATWQKDYPHQINDYDSLCSWAKELEPATTEFYLIVDEGGASPELQPYLTKANCIYHTMTETIREDESYSIYRFSVP